MTDQPSDKNADDKTSADVTPAQQAAAAPQPTAPANDPEAVDTAPPAAGVMATQADAPVPDVIASGTGMFGVEGSGDTSGYGGLQTAVVLPGATARPYGGWFDQTADVLAELLGAADEEEGPGWEGAIEYVVVDRGEMTLFVRRDHLRRVARALRDDPDLRFEMCMGVSGVHYPEDVGRELHAVYPMLSITHNRRLRLEVVCPDTDRHIPSIVETYPGNDWHERETWDFFGIVFDGHPALTRIQMPDDWPGHPQRKDYPLGGIPVEYKGATIPPPDVRRQYR